MFKKLDFMGSKKFNSNLLNENIAKKKNGTIWIGNVSHGRAHGTLSAQLINCTQPILMPSVSFLTRYLLIHRVVADALFFPRQKQFKMMKGEN